MNNMIIVGSKRNGYLINLEEKSIIGFKESNSITINYFNSLYENLFKKKIKHKEISFSEIKYINVTYSASDRSIWGIDSSLVLEVYTNDGKKYLMHGNIEATKEDFLQAYEILKAQGITFLDKYNIIRYLYSHQSKRIDIVLVDMIKKKIIPMPEYKV